MESTRDLLDDVLTWPSREVEAWLDKVVVGEPIKGEGFNWEVFAFTLAARAGDETSLPWARVALRVYEGLAARAPARVAHSLRLSEMNLRARMMGLLGPKAGDAILDPDILVAWFVGLAGVSLGDATRLVSSPDLYTQPPDLLLKLRDIKNALNVLAHVSDSDVIQKHSELTDWLKLRSRLP
ncbi:hypothetical protein [Myxococcus stipitatus]|uniref:hypothetical protein n=1 Tax=Myxococcus stipitatus TaxID=83455 RepID=UPI0030CA9A73